MGTNRWKKYKIELLPVKKISEREQIGIVKLVNKILLLVQRGENSGTSHEVQELEEKINRKVYRLYGLTEDEVGLIEQDLSHE